MTYNGANQQAGGRIVGMTKRDVQRIMDEVPGLNDFGIGVFNQRRKKPEEREKELAEGKAQLLDSVDACNKVCEWLASIDKIATINHRHSSYGLKHVAEEDIGYVTNGVFITAAIYCGYKFRVTPGSPNVEFGMSEKSIKAAMRRQKDEGKKNWAV